MKKVILNSIVASVIFSSIFVLSLYITKAWSPDPSWLTAQTWDVLTPEKWNQLLAKIDEKKWLNEATVLTCNHSINSPTVWWKTKTWAASDCWWTNKPADFTKCMSASKELDSNWWMTLFKCGAVSSQVYVNTASTTAIVKCEFLCRNQ